MAQFTGMERDQLRRAVAGIVSGKAATGASAVVRECHLLNSGLSGVRMADNRSVGRALRELGWTRDGFTGIGYDREPRFVAPKSAA